MMMVATFFSLSGACAPKWIDESVGEDACDRVPAPGVEIAAPADGASVEAQGPTALGVLGSGDVALAFASSATATPQVMTIKLAIVTDGHAQAPCNGPGQTFELDAPGAAGYREDRFASVVGPIGSDVESMIVYKREYAAVDDAAPPQPDEVRVAFASELGCPDLPTADGWSIAVSAEDVTRVVNRPVAVALGGDTFVVFWISQLRSSTSLPDTRLRARIVNATYPPSFQATALGPADAPVEIPMSSSFFIGLAAERIPGRAGSPDALALIWNEVGTDMGRTRIALLDPGLAQATPPRTIAIDQDQGDALSVKTFALGYDPQSERLLATWTQDQAATGAAGSGAEAIRVMGELLDAQAQSLSDAFTIDGSDMMGWSPTVAIPSPGQFAVAWRSGERIAFTAFDAQGNALFLNQACGKGEILASDLPTDSTHREPSLAVAGNGDVLINWIAGPDTMNTFSVWLRRFTQHDLFFLP
jgi:hypothetical protein